MSVEQISLVWKSGLCGNELTIGLALADHADDDGGKVFPSKAHLAWKTGMSERTVQRYLREFRSKGYIEVIRDATQHRPTEYRLIAINLPAKLSFEEYSRGDKTSPLTGSQGGQIVSPELAPREDKLSPLNNPGETHGASRGDTAVSRRGDTAVSPEPSLTVKNRQKTVAPDGLNTEAWAAYVDYRSKARCKKLTPEGERLAMRNLASYGDPETQRLVVEQSMSNGWTGLFPLRRNGHETNQRVDNSAPARVRRAREEWSRKHTRR